MKKIIIIVTVSLLIFAGCENKKDIPTVRIGYAPHDHHAPLYIAASKGEYFGENGSPYLKTVTEKSAYILMKNNKPMANIQLDSGTGGIHLIRKLDEKIIDMSFGGVPAIISMIDKGSNIKIVSPVMSEGAALAVDKDMPVSDWDEFVSYVKSSKAPVKIGYKVDISVQNLIFETALKYENLTYSNNIADEDVDIVVINLHGPKNLTPSLKAGVIDGFVVMQPYPAIAEEKGVAKSIVQLKDLPPLKKWKGHPCCALAASGEIITDHIDIVEALVDLFKRSGQYIVSNPEESAVITSDWLLTPVRVEEISLPTITFLSDYNDEWNNGVNFWVESLIQLQGLNGKVKEGYEKGSVGDVIYDNRFYNKNNK